MKKPLLITSLDDAGGKTLVTLGLVSEFSHKFSKIGFIKPLGVARVRAGREGIDLDAMLIEKLHAVHENIKDMCPVTLGSAAWPEITEAESARMMKRIHDSFGRITEGREAVIVEGSGGATLGACLGLSNAKIAASLGCCAVLVVSYGLMADNPFDKVVLHRDAFKAQGVETIGVVVNRVPADLLDSYRPYASSQLESMGTELLGVIPEEPRLRTFRFLEVPHHLEGEMLCNQANATRVVKTVRVGAMTPHRAIPHLTPGTLLIAPGDREDMIVSLIATAGAPGGGSSGLILTGGQRPHSTILKLLEASGVPTYLTELDSYTTASQIHDMPLRIQPSDEEKISIIQGLVVDHIDVDRIVEQI